MAESSEDSVLISVVIPTRNRARYLPQLLTALDAQEYKPFEVIVVDDASTDNTLAILKAWERAGRIALRQNEPMGSYAARNRGWRAARGEIIAFTDDDCVPQPLWLAEMVRAIIGPEQFGAAGGGPSEALPTEMVSQRRAGLRWPASIRSHVTVHPDIQPPAPHTVVGVQGVTLAVGGEITPFTHQIQQMRLGPPYRTCNIAYRREALEQLGGFDERLRWYADNILGLRMRQIGTIAFAPKAVVHHPPRPREWRDRTTWLARFHADALHREVLYQYTREPRVATSLLPLILWVLRPFAQQGRVHAQYLLRHPKKYMRQVGPMAREKLALVLALRDYRRELHVQPTHPEPLPTLPAEPLVSVLVVTRDRRESLEGLLACLEQQTWKKYEVVIVEHLREPRASSSQLSALSSQLSAHRSWLTAHGTLAAARQIGVEAAQGDIIAFTDDDCLPEPEWLSRLVTAFQRQSGLWGVQGRTVAQKGPIGSHAVRVDGPDPLYQTCNMAYRREAIERAGGFDERFDGWFEDTALGARVLRHGPIGFAADAVVVHRAIPRVAKDRATWQRIVRDERLLAREYPSFYRETRGRTFLSGVVKHWLIGSPLKTLLRQLPRARQDMRAYRRLARIVTKEQRELLRVLTHDVRYIPARSRASSRGVLLTIHVDGIIHPETSFLEDSMAESEKITINMGVVDLGQIDLLVEQGFYSSRTDFIRSAIRRQLDTHGAEVKQTVARKAFAVGILTYSRADLERYRAEGKELDLRALGLLHLGNDIDADLARQTIRSLMVRGVFRASDAVKAALADRMA